MDSDAADSRLIVRRDELVDAATFIARVMDDPNTTDELRADARDTFEDVSWWLLYNDGRVRLVPMIFGWPGACTELVDELLLDLGDRVRADNPVSVEMARHTACLIDTHAFSDSFRLDCWDALQGTLGVLKAAADDLAADDAKVEDHENV